MTSHHIRGDSIVLSDAPPGGAAPAPIRYPFKCEGRLATFGPAFPYLLATVNCHASSSSSAATTTTTTSSRPSAATADVVRSNRQQGPVLLEIMQVRWSGGEDVYESYEDVQRRPRSWTTHPVARSRSNPSLGTSLASTCLDAMPMPTSTAAAAITTSPPCYDEENFHTMPPPTPVVTGLTTGALCLHTFGYASASADPTTAGNHDPGAREWVPRIDFYQSPTRHHRPATCVAWRQQQGPRTTHQEQQPTNTMNLVAIGLVAASSSSSSSNPSYSTSAGGVNLRDYRTGAPLSGGGSSAVGADGGGAASGESYYQVGSRGGGGDSPAVPGRDGKGASGQEAGDSGLGSSSSYRYDRSISAPTTATTRSHRAGGTAAAMSGGMANLSIGGSSVGGGGASGTASSASDREYCCLLWDVEHQSSSSSSTSEAQPAASSSTSVVAPWSPRRSNSKSVPLHKLSHQMGVASLAWLMDGNVLACGGQLRSLQLYDLRASAGSTGGGGGTSAASASSPVSVSYAHNFAVHVRAGCDPTRPWMLASFCKSPNEPVKVWDCRKLDSTSGPVAEIKIKSSDYSSYVSAIQWSPSESGRLVIALGNTLHEYDVLSSSGIFTASSSSALRAVPAQTLYAKEAIADFCLPSFDKRIMAVSPGGNPSVFDTARHTYSPVALSRRDGRIASAFGRTLRIGTSSHGPAAMERDGTRLPRALASASTVAPASIEDRDDDDDDDDVSAVMMRRAKCQHVVRYSMDPTSNIRVLLQEARNGSRSSQLSLLRVWSWIERVEELCGDPDELGDAGARSGFYWPAKGLLDAGVARLVTTLNVQHDPDVESLAETLNCITYESFGRKAALASCGWAGKYSLVNVLAECEDYGEFERSAALAVWHGDIGAAVDALDRGSTYVRGLLSSDRRRSISHYETTFITSHYADLLELVSVCVAGFRAGDVESSSSCVWRRSCSNLMQRVGATVKQHVSSSRISYIRGLLRFLACLGSGTGYQEVLGDESLSLVDRVAFACRFLPRDDLLQFVTNSAEACQRSGNCEGLVVTGLDREGIQILQAFVDSSTDVQSTALITSRVILPPDWTMERGICLEWLDSYRALLNTWQMWQSRAMFDVDRAEVLRKVKARRIAASYSVPAPTTSISSVTKSTGSVSSLSSRARSTGLGGRTKSTTSRHADPDVMASIPAQIDARCNYCSAPLGLKSQDTHSSQLLSKMKPVLSCCPQCRKPLPRCAICLLPLGTLNPYMELLTSKDSSSRQISSGSGGGGGGSGIAGSSSNHASTDLSSLASLPLAEWFSWCMRCKHGGHAHHWIGWFAKHEVCPVSGCDCRCQFDGIKTLKRGAYGAPPSAFPSPMSHKGPVEIGSSALNR